MITIDDTLYGALAAELALRLRDTHFFNGSVDYDTEEFHSSLTCTLVVHREPDSRRMVSIVPVWWEYHLHQHMGEVPTTFSWREFASHLETCF